MLRLKDPNFQSIGLQKSWRYTQIKDVTKALQSTASNMVKSCSEINKNIIASPNWHLIQEKCIELLCVKVIFRSLNFCQWVSSWGHYWDWKQRRQISCRGACPQWPLLMGKGTASRGRLRVLSVKQRSHLFENGLMITNWFNPLLNYALMITLR